MQTVGQIFADERLNGMDQAAKERYALDLVQHGPPRPNAVLSPEAEKAAAPSDGEFDPDRELFRSVAYRSEPYTMPGGGKVHVHPLSIDERLDLNLDVSRELEKAGLYRAPDSPERALQNQREINLRAQFLGKAWQVIWCCRKGPGADSSRVFQPKHLTALRRNPGWAEAVDEIAALSDRLSAGDSEAALLREALTGFFGDMERWLATLCTPRNETSSISLSETLQDFAGSVSNLKRQGPPSVASLNALAMWCRMSTPEETP